MKRKFRTAASLTACLGFSVIASEAFASDEYAPQLPDMALFRTMLEANKQPGWIAFRNFSGQQLIYFTALQTLNCRLSKIRYSINSDALDKEFPLGKCDPQLPFNLPEGTEYIYLSLPPGTAKTIAVQAVWDDGAGSEIVVYKPCENVGESTCARIETINKPAAMQEAPAAPNDGR
ncbi:hypothetical protein [Rhizobium sp. L1K21]|uniref:hypothetical protein n=1 Tax=Rhizobium sp. L1K21 TaxID=2954933 RepID=UPI0020934726|nr:hypothetical protein [Rhizobium sp. L1K21]MCO6187942.1 hypothetical protein [Rhizobium sp. L1K21]